MHKSDLPECTLYELLGAIAMSEYFQKTHVLFLPPGKEYTAMLNIAKNKKLIKPLGLTNYVLTAKGHTRFQRHRSEQVKKMEKEINDFIDKL